MSERLPDHGTRPTRPRHPLRRGVLLTASSLSGGALVAMGLLLPAGSAMAQAGIAGAGESGSTVKSSGSTPLQGSQAASVAGGTFKRNQPTPTESITVKIRKRLIREKNPPSAATELGANAIQQVGVQGSIATLLRQAPSVFVYQSGIGNNEPVLTIRGLRGNETAATLDGFPTQDLLYGGTGSFLNGILGARFDLSQISGVTLYPGVAFPAENTFGTIGGTIAYNSLRPSADRGLDVLGSVGSFGTWQEGFTANSGKLDGPFGTGYNAPSMLLQYTNLQAKGWIDYTPSRFNNMEFALDKPYDDGLSKFEGTFLYNTGSGKYQDEPTPLPYLVQNGRFSNPSPDQQFAYQYNSYASVFLKDSTYINDTFAAGLGVFYERYDGYNEDYGNPNIFYATAAHPGSITVGGAPFFNRTAAGFGTAGGFGPGGPYYDPAVGITYDGASQFPRGSANCPASVYDAFVSSGQASPCGYNAAARNSSNDTYGVQPSLTITPRSIFGFVNTIKVGALIAKETAPLLGTYQYGTTPVPETLGNLTGGVFSGQTSGGVSRAIYQPFIQDKIDYLHNTLHVTPGLTFEYSDSSFTSASVYRGVPTAGEAANPYCQDNPCRFGDYHQTKSDRELLPFVNAVYDLDRILPIAKGVSVYGSYGESALFAPVSDFRPNLIGASPPSASVVHLYEGGVRYNISTVTLSADYYYQKVDRDFGFFEYESGPLTGQSLYNNLGQRQFQGQEAQAIWQITPQWQVFGNFSHIRARYLKTDVSNVTVQEDQFGDVLRGTPITGIPHYSATFGADYDHKSWFLGGDEFHARLEAQFTGKQDTTYDVDGFTNIGPIPQVGPYPTYDYYNATSGATTYDPNGGIPAFMIWNLDLNYQLPVKQLGVKYLQKLDFDLNILNLFNHMYFQYVYKQITPTNPITFPPGSRYAGQMSTNYNSPSFGDALAGEPFAATFTVTAHF